MRTGLLVVIVALLLAGCGGAPQSRATPGASPSTRTPHPAALHLSRTDALRIVRRLVAQAYPGRSFGKVNNVELAQDESGHRWIKADVWHPPFVRRTVAAVVAEAFRGRWILKWCYTGAASARLPLRFPLAVVLQLFPTHTHTWAGYEVFGHRFTSVAATWTVPMLVARGEPTAAVAVWVGLDDGSHTIEQTGVQCTLRKSSLPFDSFPWYEMYPQPPHAGLPVQTSGGRVNLEANPGDAITAEVSYLGRDRFRLTLINHTWGETFTTVQRSRQARCSSAEIIVERLGTTADLRGMAAVRFTGCAVNGRRLGSWDCWKQEIWSANRTELTMTSQLDRSGTSFVVTSQ